MASLWGCFPPWSRQPTPGLYRFLFEIATFRFDLPPQAAVGMLMKPRSFQIVIQTGEEVDGMIMIRDGENRTGACPLKYLTEV